MINQVQIIEISSAARERLAKIASPELLQRLRGEMDRQNALTVSYAQAAFLSFSKSGPSVVPLGLRVQSNRLRNSLRTRRARVSAGVIQSGIGSNVRYAAPWEFGFDGVVMVGPHLRKNVRKQSFNAGTTKTGRVKYVSKRVRGADIHVVAHRRKMRLPAVHYVYRGLLARSQEYNESFSRIILETK